MGVSSGKAKSGDCKYCEISNNGTYFLNTMHWVVALHEDQKYIGRCKVILKRHAGDLDQLSDAEWSDLSRLVKKLENSLRLSFNATMFNWTCLMNEAFRKTSAPNPHVHWHFRPRYKKNVKFSGLVFVDKEFGTHY
ncbi:MAG: HIT family protein, partial [Candidatus Marsarchaeota archaeon]|nr:HIT family protein [Candidatus Marsarchaeota archaeon]